ncbi:MAG: nitroreductase family protein [Candidatus Cryptobacteroides sp.]
MNSFKDLAQLRRSHRQYTQEPVSQEELETVLRAALMAPTGKGLRKWSFAVTSDRRKIEALSKVRTHGSAFLASAPTVIAVMGSPAEQDMWIEDGSIAAVSMQYQAADLGLGTCWCQIRSRESSAEGVSADSLVREILGIGDDKSVLCLIALGHPSDERKPQDEESLRWEQVIHAD